MFRGICVAFSLHVYTGPINRPGLSDGRRFLLVKPGVASSDGAAAQIVVVQNWFEELKRLVRAN
ncbi:MAG: hypothetical protein A3F70_00610 [Acidobacteria bacterium RIFCSPLOWO2_12_FULL_67_14]|nr:MAG: hypothetical protein A3H29_12865 [Acidobacteria bacterium RIFCSPLOWO2_02_FULL_67_21]OFW38770.1 MAG: hypothetical protein A3F70_00610 [Acidobacteria bacterium RIFCSPLOWO2_12_FULL_67_14]